MNRVLLPACILFLCAACTVAAQPLNPFKPKGRSRPDARPGTVSMSTGETYKGHIYVTRDKRLRIYDTTAKLYRDMPLVAVKRIDIAVEKEGIEKEWRWKEGGSNVKVYTGKSYPWRQYITTITLTNDQKITGHFKPTPVYVESDGKKRKLIVQGKSKGKLGQKLSDLVYIKKIVFDQPDEE